jgi:uncharacterized membrane protein
MLSRLFEPHTREAIQAGRFEFAHALPPLLAGMLLLLLVLAVWLLYRHTTRAVDSRWKAAFMGLRTTALLLLFLMLLRPSVTTLQVSPQETYLAVLIDDSASMAVRDMGDESRLTQVQQALFAEDGVLAELEELFQLRLFRFDSRASRLREAGELTAAGSDSWLGQALSDLEDQFAGLRLGGVVLVSDGADSGNVDALAVSQRFADRDVPVFTVGVGLTEIPRDVAIIDVSADRTILDDTVFSLDVSLSQRGYAGESVELRVLDGDQVVARKTVQLGPDGSQRRYELDLDPSRREPILYQLEFDALPGEIITENNRYHFLVDNSPRPPLNILYVEGHPRNEFKFVRRSVADDENLRLASYLQTGPGRFYRQGITSPLELSEGFPRNREDLYRYDAMIIGDVGREFFSDEQIGMIQDFVAECGGGLLVSGMMEDAYVESRMADILPLTLVRTTQLPAFLQGGIRRGSHPTGELFVPHLTREGELSQMLRLSADDERNRSLWHSLPELQGVYVTGRAKPGATVLLEHPVLQFQGQALPVLATQRYGAGRAMSLATASTWRWQMLMHSSDDSHERLWRQIMRWLAISSPQQISVAFDRDFYHVGDTATITATVLDERFQPDNNASLWLQLTDPRGQVVDSAMRWDISEDGVYRSEFQVEQEGLHRVLIDATVAGAGETASEIQSAFVVTPSLREFSDAAQDANLLTRIAQTANGAYLPLSDIDQLAAQLTYTPSAYSREVREDLWDHPLLLWLLIGLLSAEWVLRRRRGLS